MVVAFHLVSTLLLHMLDILLAYFPIVCLYSCRLQHQLLDIVVQLLKSITNLARGAVTFLSSLFEVKTFFSFNAVLYRENEMRNTSGSTLAYSLLVIGIRILTKK